MCLDDLTTESLDWDTAPRRKYNPFVSWTFIDISCDGGDLPLKQFCIFDFAPPVHKPALERFRNHSYLAGNRNVSLAGTLCLLL